MGVKNPFCYRKSFLPRNCKISDLSVYSYPCSYSCIFNLELDVQFIYRLPFYPFNISTAINFHFNKTLDYIFNEKLCNNDKRNYAQWINEYWNYKDVYIVKKHRISYTSNNNRTERTLQIHLMFNRQTFMSGKWIFVL